MPLVFERVHESLLAHHPETARHCARLAHLLTQITPSASYGYVLAVMCHDVGKLDVPVSILDKAGPLSPDDWACMRRHPEKGVCRYCALVQDMHMLLDPMVLDVIYYHHERWDGCGYPRGLRGAAIPAEARLVSILDAFDAMVTPRSYGPVLSFRDAADEILNGAGSQFDPVLVADIMPKLQRSMVYKTEPRAMRCVY